jgi:hypothetical protein
MNTKDRRGYPARAFFAAAGFYILSALLLPVMLAGYAVWIAGALRSGRGSGVSGTAQGSLSARFFSHVLGARRDEPAARLMLALPNVPPLGLRLFVGPMLLTRRITGYVPKAFRYPYEGDIPPQYQAAARMTFFDSVVERRIAGADQFVILGAGFDTRVPLAQKRRRAVLRG